MANWRLPQVQVWPFCCTFQKALSNKQAWATCQRIIFVGFSCSWRRCWFHSEHHSNNKYWRNRRKCSGWTSLLSALHLQRKRRHVTIDQKSWESWLQGSSAHRRYTVLWEEIGRHSEQIYLAFSSEVGGITDLITSCLFSNCRVQTEVWQLFTKSTLVSFWQNGKFRETGLQRVRRQHSEKGIWLEWICQLPVWSVIDLERRNLAEEQHQITNCHQRSANWWMFMDKYLFKETSRSQVVCIRRW